MTYSDELRRFFPAEIPPSQILEILNKAQQNCLDRAGELLTPKWEPFGPLEPSDKPPTLEELADRIPYDIMTEEQLEQYVRDRAKKVVQDRRDAGQRIGEELTPDMVESYVRRSLPYVHRAWRIRRQYWLAKLQEILNQKSDRRLALSHAPEPAEIDPTAGKLAIHVSCPDLNSLDATRRTKINWIARRLTGKAPEIAFETYWEWYGADGDMAQNPTTSGAEATRKTFVVNQPGAYIVAAYRTIKVRIGSEQLSGEDVAGDAEIEVTMKPNPGIWYAMTVTQEQRRQGPPFATNMVPDRILWSDPSLPDAQAAQVTLNYVSKVEGKQPLSGGSKPGIPSMVTVTAVRDGQDYVIRGETLNQIASKAEFSWRYGIVSFVLGVADIMADVDVNDEETRRRKAENEAARQKAENMTIAVHHAEFRLRRDGNRLRLRIRGSLTSTMPDEEPVGSQADIEIFGTPITQPMPPVVPDSTRPR